MEQPNKANAAGFVVACRMDESSTGSDGKHHPFMYVKQTTARVFGMQVPGYRLVTEAADATAFTTETALAHIAKFTMLRGPLVNGLPRVEVRPR